MKSIATPQVAPAAIRAEVQSPPRKWWRALRSWLGRHVADAWLNFLFWSARQYPEFTRWSKPLWMWGAWTMSPALRNNTLRNARWILGDGATDARCEALGKSVIGNFYDFVCDVGRSLGMTPRQMLARIKCVEGDAFYQAARKDGKGAIVVTAHMGSFEVGMAALREQERRVHVLYRRDALGLFEKTRTTLRKRLGVIESCVDNGLSVWIKLRDALAANEVVLIQGDRVMPGQKGRRIPFFGGQILLPTGPVKLAMATGAPIIPIFSVRCPDGGIRLFVEEPIRLNSSDSQALDAALQRLSNVIEKYVRAYPEQWLVLHRAWCEDADQAGDRSKPEADPTS